MQLHLQTIEKIGAQYGMKLNHDKCIVICYNDTRPIKFANGNIVKTLEEVTYLGCNLNQDTDMTRELKKRIGKCEAILQKMHVFWLHSGSTLAFKKQGFKQCNSIKIDVWPGRGTAESGRLEKAGPLPP